MAVSRWGSGSPRRRHRARAADTEPAIPRLTERLADPGFAPLAQWLRQRQVDPAELQAAIDQCLAQARQTAETP